MISAHPSKFKLIDLWPLGTIQSFLRRQGSPCYTKHVPCSRFWGVSPPHLLHFSICLTLRQIGLCSPFWGGMFSPWYSKHVPCRGGLFAAPPYRSQPYIQIYVMQMEHFFAKTVFLLPPPFEHVQVTFAGFNACAYSRFRASQSLQSEAFFVFYRSLLVSWNTPEVFFETISPTPFGSWKWIISFGYPV